MRFADRRDAGRRLAVLLQRYQGPDVVVLALPRGGVVVGLEVARALRAPLDVLVVRKLGAPGMRELALGAIAENGAVWLDRGLLRQVGVSDDELQRVTAEELNELRRRVQAYRDGRELTEVIGRTVLLIDDGIATGATAHAALQALRALRPRRVVLAAPVVSRAAVSELSPRVDALVYCSAPEDFQAVGCWYEDFTPVEDAEVVACLEAAAAPPPLEHAARNDDTLLEVDGHLLPASIVVPQGASAVVLFAHGSGSSRHSPRNRQVARVLERDGLATVLFDLLTEEEARRDDADGSLRFDVMFLASRLVQATRQVLAREPLRGLPAGYFGASTGAAAALIAATLLPDVARAVVSRGGRPDLVSPAQLSNVHAPTLFIVGGEDRDVLALNQVVAARLPGLVQLRVIPGATHLFEEPGALEQVAQLASLWFRQHLVSHAATTTPH